MLTVACVYWKGKFRGRERLYNPEWVTKLQNMVKRNLDVPHRFVCLSNSDVPCEKIPLIHDYPGYWSKIELFRPGLFEDRVMYLDLDVLVLRNLLPIVNFNSKFAMSATTGRETYKENKRMLCKHSSSLMVWNAGVPDYLYEKFKVSPDHYRSYYFGDQDFMAGEAEFVDELPFEWAKKLRDCVGFQPTKNMIVAYCQLGKMYPGKNYRIVKEFEWAREIWK